MLSTILLVVLVLLLVGAIPSWGYNSGWGYGPVGIIAILLVVFLLFGNRLHL